MYWWNSGSAAFGGDRFDLMMTYDSKYWGQRVKARGGEAERGRERGGKEGVGSIAVRHDPSFV